MDGILGILGLHAGRPAYLLVLLLVPVLWALSYRALAALGPVRRAIALALRTLVIVLIACALADVQAVRTVDDQTAVFVLDTSQSLAPELQQAGFEFIKQTAATMRPDRDRVALVVCSGDARIEQIAYHDLRVQQYSASPRPDETNLAAGLRMARAIVPPDTARRIVLLSDGNENAGDALAEADRLAAERIPVDVLPLNYVHREEVIVERFSAPARAQEDDRISLDLVLRATRPTKGHVLIYHNDVPVDLDPAAPGAEAAVTLNEGLNRLTLPVRLPQRGVHRFEAVFAPDDSSDDTLFANNRGQAFTMVGGGETALVIVDHGLEPGATADLSAQVLVDALEAAGVTCTLRAVEQVTLSPEALMGYSLVVLSNVSAITVGEDQQRALASYVRDLGGGLVVVGGDQAFGLGGYYRSPLESILPVVTDRKKLQLLSTSMVIVVDQSGSMVGEKIERARQAAQAAVDLLGPMDQIGVVAFAGEYRWVVPLAPCTNKALIQRRLAGIASGGGTVMYPALAAAGVALYHTDTNVRHIILLTDGQSAPGDFDRLSRTLKNEGITVSAIAIGDDADHAQLQRIADLTGGRMYRTSNAAPLPQIFVRETVLAGRSGAFEREFMPQLRSGTWSPLVTGLRQEELPPLFGYNVTAARPEATVPLVRNTERGADPILAHWQVGLGQAIGFTSGMWPKWGHDWSSWSGFSKFWGQVARSAARPPDGTEFDVQTTVDGQRATVMLEAADAMRLMRGGLQISARVVGPDYEVQTLDLRPVGLGRFEADFPIEHKGAHIVRFAYAWQENGQAKSAGVQASVTVPYGAEYRALRSNEAFLVDIARRTEGRLLYAEQPEAVFEPWIRQPVQTRRPVWDWFVRLAMAAFLLDVGVRRLAINPIEMFHRVERGIAGLVSSAPTASATMASLREAQRKREDAGAGRASGAPRRSDAAGLERASAAAASSPISLSELRTRREAQSVDDANRTGEGTRERSGIAGASAEGEGSEGTTSADGPTSPEDARARLLRAKRRALRGRGEGADPPA